MNNLFLVASSPKFSIFLTQKQSLISAVDDTDNDDIDDNDDNDDDYDDNDDEDEDDDDSDSWRWETRTASSLESRFGNIIEKLSLEDLNGVN